jgi:hypothetical protein
MGPLGPVTVTPTRSTVTCSKATPGEVLGPVDVADLGVGGHDHRRRAVQTHAPGAGGGGGHAVFVVDHVFAEVPDRSVVGLGVEVDRDLGDPTLR